MTRPGGTWQNWARSASVRPQAVERPSSIGAVVRAVEAAAARERRIKAVGSGHSFTGIAVASGVLVDLAALTGVVSVDRARSRVTLLAGTPLHAIPALLEPYGLAMQNLGDIDRQTIAGAISTGTHGTGAAFGGVATQVVGATLVTGTGELLRISDDENADLLPAIAIGLGALGILVEVTLQCVPRFVLEAVDRPEPLQDVLDDLPARLETDHFEFYWFASTEVALTKTNTRLPADAPLSPLPTFGKWFDETFMTNGVYRVVCATGAAVPAVVPSLSRLAVRMTGNRTYTDWSNRVFTQQRTVRFREMEYAVPLEQFRDAFGEVRALIARRGWKISFPLEVRFASADDRWLSTAYGRPSAYIALHRYWREDPTAYFTEVEKVLMEHGGRPHWGKMHTLDAAALSERYPRFGDFLAARDRLDPRGLFRNAYLDRVLGA